MSQKLQLSASHKAGYGFTKSANERRSSPMLIRGNHRPHASPLHASAVLTARPRPHSSDKARQLPTWSQV